MRRLTMFTLASAILIASTFADDVGTVVFVEGFPGLTRDGRPSSEIVDFGFRVENYDFFQTDSRSSFEIELDPVTGVAAAIIVEPSTSFYLELSDLRTEQTGAIELLTGSITTRAQSLAGASRFEVRTESAVAGVRGTTFTVSTSVGGEILVSAEEGLVEVTYDERRTLFARPGEAVEVIGDENRASTLRYEIGANIVRTWREEREAIFENRAPQILGFYGREYRRARDVFTEAYTRLMEQREIVDTWINEDERSERLRPSEAVRRAQVAARIAADVARVRLSSRRFESLLVRLDRMAPAVENIAADVELPDGTTAQELYLEINAERALLYERLATVRYVLKLYSQRRGEPGAE